MFASIFLLLTAESLKKRGDHESYSEIADITTSGGATGSTSSKNANGRKIALQIPGLFICLNLFVLDYCQPGQVSYLRSF